MKITEVLVRPVLTEKATKAAQTKLYTFEVHPRATKTQIKTAIFDLYGVKTTGISLNVRKGKVKRVGKMMKSKKMISRKIAYIQIKEGTINLFPQA